MCVRLSGCIQSMMAMMCKSVALTLRVEVMSSCTKIVRRISKGRSSAPRVDAVF